MPRWGATERRARNASVTIRQLSVSYSRPLGPRNNFRWPELRLNMGLTRNEHASVRTVVSLADSRSASGTLTSSQLLGAQD